MPRIELSRSRLGRYGAYTLGFWVTEYLVRSRRPDSGRPGLRDVYRNQRDTVEQRIGHSNDDRFKAIASKVLFR